MEKILVSVSVPAVNREFDMFLPRDLRIETMLHLIVSGIEEAENGRYIPSGKEMLVEKEHGQVLREDSCLNDYLLLDGAGLVLM